MKLIVGMTGATGAPLGVALLQALRDMPNVETHLVMSKWAKTTIELETPYSAHDVAALADFSHNPADQAAIISSGSFRTDGMIVIPCSMKTLAGIRAGYADGLVGRAAKIVGAKPIRQTTQSSRDSSSIIRLVPVLPPRRRALSKIRRICFSMSAP